MKNSPKTPVLQLAAFAVFTMIFIQPSGAWAKEKVTPVEDLMREHGVLRRVLLVYENQLESLKDGRPVRYDVLSKAATIVRDFIEGYHEKLEEKHIFPLFEKKGEFADVTQTLREQHDAGRRMTQAILQSANQAQTEGAAQPQALAGELRAFIRMYRPHAAREDTELFPALHGLISAKEYDKLGDEFEDKEQELFGESGFEGKVKEVAALEKELGIYELSQF